MKNFRFILLIAVLVSVTSITKPVLAQEKTREELERELRVKEEIDAQKKALQDQKKARDEASLEFKKSEQAIEEAMKEAEKQIEESAKINEALRGFRLERDFPRFRSEDFVFASPNVEPFMWHFSGSESNMSMWNFSKSLKENSFSGDYTFDVESDAQNVVMSISGDCKDGEIRIKIVSPNNKTYSDIVIDEFGNLNWKKSFKISEEENKDKTGRWKFQVNADKATGFFKISLQTY